MADLIPLHLDANLETTQILIQDLQRRLTAGEDLGSRSIHIRRLRHNLQKTLRTLKQVLSDLDSTDPATRRVIEAGHQMIVIAECNLVVAEKII